MHALLWLHLLPARLQLRHCILLDRFARQKGLRIVQSGTRRHLERRRNFERAKTIPFHALMAEQADWGLSSDQRKSTVARVAANIATITFSKGQQLSDADAERAAENAERKAYTVARVEAKTTTGVRPHSETYEAYTRCVPALLYLQSHQSCFEIRAWHICCRKLAALVLEAVTQGNQQAQPPTQNGTDSAHVSQRFYSLLDLIVFPSPIALQAG